MWDLGILKDEGQFRQISLDLEERGVVDLVDKSIPTRGGENIPADVYLMDRAAVIQCNIRDISARKQSEGAIHDLARFPTENPNPVMRIDRGGTLLYANEAALVHLADWKLELGNQVTQVLNDPIQEVIETGTTNTVELTSGERIFSIAIGPTPKGNDVNVYGIDITDRKRAEEKTLYQAYLLEQVNDAVIGSDSEMRLIAWNRAAERVYGWKPEEVLGRQTTEVMRTEWAEGDIKEMIKAIEAQGKWRGEATHIKKDGNRIPVELSTMVLREANGKMTGYVTVARDITERKQAEEEIRQLNTTLEQRVEERTRQICTRRRSNWCDTRNWLSLDSWRAEWDTNCATHWG